MKVTVKTPPQAATSDRVSPPPFRTALRHPQVMTLQNTCLPIFLRHF